MVMHFAWLLGMEMIKFCNFFLVKMVKRRAFVLEAFLHAFPNGKTSAVFFKEKNILDLERVR